MASSPNMTGKTQLATLCSYLAQAVEGYAKGNYFVAVDGIVGPWFIHLFRRLGLPLHYIVAAQRLTPRLGYASNVFLMAARDFPARKQCG